MNDAFFSLLCTNEFLAAMLLVLGVLAHQLIRHMDRVIRETRHINHDLYRAIIFPYRKRYEADVTGFTALFFYARFRRAILSRDFRELDVLRTGQRAIAVYAIVFLACVSCLAVWIANCKAL